jgi:hypothetical protein
MKHPQYQRVGYHEVDMTLRQYLVSYNAVHTHTSTQTNNYEIKAEKSNPPPKIYALKQDVFKWFLESERLKFLNLYQEHI